ncbi:MAG: substrate-binding domain-containing protein [Terriglobales bacterium]
MQSAAYSNPTFTTPRQPLQRMGEIAARTLLSRIDDPERCLPELSIEPELVVRTSTTPLFTRIRENFPGKPRNQRALCPGPRSRYAYWLRALVCTLPFRALSAFRFCFLASPSGLQRFRFRCSRAKRHAVWTSFCKTPLRRRST